MEQTLILFFHPARETSRTSRALAGAVRDFKAVTFHDLREEHPHFQTGIEVEQMLINSQRHTICQHPFSGDSTPALMQE